MARVKKGSRPVVRPEDIDDLVGQLMVEGRERGTSLRGRVPGRIYARRIHGSVESFDELLRDAMREGLLDEVVPASESVGGSISKHEVQHEVLKKALVGLKLEALKRIARTKGLAVTASSEELAERIARAFGWDEQEIARLVLENEESIREDRGFVTRFFPLREAPDLSQVRSRLQYVEGRYIRIGVAKWFVFEDLAFGEEFHDLSGSLRAYSADVDDRIVDKPQVVPRPTQDGAFIRISSEALLEVRNASPTTSRFATRALSTAALVETMGRIPFIDPTAPAVKGEIHDASRFLLDLLFNRFPGSGFGEINLTTARFRVGEAPESAAWNAEVEQRPVLRAVAIEGNHILGSIPACRMLAVEQRPMTDIAMQITVRDKDRVIVGRFPMRVSIERDHISVQTGFGAGNQEMSSAVHRAAVTCVVSEINDGYGNEDRLDEMIALINERASSEAPPEEGDSLVIVNHD